MNEQLLEITDTFEIEDEGLVLSPILPVPNTTNDITFIESVEVESPSGRRQTMECKFTISHAQGESGLNEWNLVLILPDARSSDVELHSRIFVTEEVFDKVQ